MKFIRKSVNNKNYRISRHATLRRFERGISIEDLELCLMNGEVIERNPKDKPYPSFLVLGFVKSGDPLHVKCSRSTKEPCLRIVTVYEPDENEWESDYKTRKKKKRKRKGR